MNIWLVQDGEPLPGIDENTRDWRTAMLAKTLVVRGHQVLWWASTFNHANKRHRFDAPHTVELQPGLQVRLLHGPGYASNRSLRRFVHNRTLAALYAEEAHACPPPDLVFCSIPTLEFAEQCVIFGRTRHVPVIVDVRDAWPDIYLTMFPRILRRFARLVLAAEFRRAERIFRFVSAILAVSDTYLVSALKYADRPRDIMDAVFPLGYQASDSILTGIDTLRFQASYGIRTDSLVVTFVGIFGFSYDLETVVHAAKVLQGRYQNKVQIILVGDGDAGLRLREMAGSCSSLVFTGWLDRQSIQVLLTLSSVGLAAYREEATQTLPNKPFEYMAAGLPLLSSLPGELEFLITEHQIGLHYQAGNVQSLVEKIVWLAEHPKERIAMGQRARKLFEERFRADIIYSKLAMHLERVADDAVASSISTLPVQ